MTLLSESRNLQSAVINNYKLSEIGSTDLPEMGLKLCKRGTVIFLDS